MNNIRIQVSSTDTRDTRYISKRTNMPDKEQDAWAFLTDSSGVEQPYPSKITFITEKGPYPVGDYTLHPSSFWVGSFGKLTCNVRLTPVKKA